MLLVEAIKITHRFNNASENVINNFDLKIETGDWLVITGRSGIGKTTILKILSGLILPNEGEVVINGEKISNLNTNCLVRLRLEIFSYVFQEFQLIKHLSIIDNILLPLWYQKKETKPAWEVLEKMDLVGLKNRLPKEISGGQKQRVALARAIAVRPTCLIADEPFSALDPKTTIEIARILNYYRQKFNMTMVMVSHDLDCLKKFDIKYLSL